MTWCAYCTPVPALIALFIFCADIKLSEGSAEFESGSAKLVIGGLSVKCSANYNYEGTSASLCFLLSLRFASVFAKPGSASR